MFLFLFFNYSPSLHLDFYLESQCTKWIKVEPSSWNGWYFCQCGSNHLLSACSSEESWMNLWLWTTPFRSACSESNGMRHFHQGIKLLLDLQFHKLGLRQGPLWSQQGFPVPLDVVSKPGQALLPLQRAETRFFSHRLHYSEVRGCLVREPY